MRKKTVFLLVASAVGLSLYDIVAEAREGESATISQVITDSSKEHPIIAVAFGILMGHWFWS